MPNKPEGCSYRYPDEHTCSIEVYAFKLCLKHYTQKRRGRLGKTHEESAEGEGDQITFHINSTLKESAEVRAKQQKLTLGAYLRGLIESDLKG